MHVQIKKWGNSAGIPLSKSVLEQLHAKHGDELDVSYRDGGLFLKPIVEQEESLEELLRSCTPEKMQLDREDQEWLDSTPVGAEIIE